MVGQCGAGIHRWRINGGTKKVNKSATISAGLAFVALATPAVVVGQTYVSDVGIEKDDVKIGAKKYSPHLNRAQRDRGIWGDDVGWSNAGAYNRGMPK